MTQQLTQEQALVITGFTGVMAVKDFGDFHADVEKRLGRPVMTHEFAGSVADDVKDAYRDDFMKMVGAE